LSDAEKQTEERFLVAMLLGMMEAHGITANTSEKSPTS
jgi:hypothetical protein